MQDQYICRSLADRMKYHMRHTFHIRDFRGDQEAIIATTMQNKDVLAIMRTGGGKSLCYQLPAVLESESEYQKVTIVISPLLSLIFDQTEQMNQMIPGSAVAFTSCLTLKEKDKMWRSVRNRSGGVALIFVTPEMVGRSALFKGEMEKLHKQGRLGRIVIDECHCACEWGHDFRIDYCKIGILKHHFCEVPVLALTATASDIIQKECIKMFNMKSCQIFRSSVNRRNLIYSVRCKPNRKDAVTYDIITFIGENHTGESGIIYTLSRREADEVAEKLRNNGIVALSYHAGLDAPVKKCVQRSWMRNKTQVVVATIAFGLGINKPDVRFVIHHTLPKSIGAYHQESGRAGRDGEPAECVLYYSPRDIPRVLPMVNHKSGIDTFWLMVRYGQAHGDDELCRHILSATFGEADNTGRYFYQKLDNCTTTITREVGQYCQTVTELVRALNISTGGSTLNQVVKKWRRSNHIGNDLNEKGQ